MDATPALCRVRNAKERGVEIQDWALASFIVSPPLPEAPQRPNVLRIVARMVQMIEVQGLGPQAGTLCVVAVITSLLLWFYMGRPPAEPPKKARSYRRTYRVEGVDESWDETKFKAHLEGQGLKNPIVQSFANEAGSNTKTATIVMDSNAPTKKLDFKLDKDFFGVTTLYAPPPEDHQVELVELLS